VVVDVRNIFNHGCKALLGFVTDFGSNNKMVQKLLEATIKAKLAKDHAESSWKLDFWSSEIRIDYERKNALIANADDATMCDIIQQQSVLINQLVLSRRNTERHFSAVSGELAALHETVESQSTLIVSTLTASLVGALRLAWQGQ
jgi:hypothetical protein